MLLLLYCQLLDGYSIDLRWDSKMICPWCNKQMCFIQYSYPESTSNYKIKYTTYYSNYYCPYCGHSDLINPGPINTMQKIVEENEEEEIITGVS